jgi:hypothetical protein
MEAKTDAWGRVHDAAARLKPIHLRDLFARDPARFDTLSARLDDLLIDFSKEKLDAPALAALLSLARISDVEARRDAMFAGEPVNLTENRASLHTALRGGAGRRVLRMSAPDALPATRAPPSPMSSPSASAGLSLVRRWRRGRWLPGMTVPGCISFRMSTAPT